MCIVIARILCGYRVDFYLDGFGTGGVKDEPQTILSRKFILTVLARKKKKTKIFFRKKQSTSTFYPTIRVVVFLLRVTPNVIHEFILPIGPFIEEKFADILSKRKTKSFKSFDLIRGPRPWKKSPHGSLYNESMLEEPPHLPNPLTYFVIILIIIISFFLQIQLVAPLFAFYWAPTSHHPHPNHHKLRPIIPAYSDEF